MLTLIKRENDIHLFRIAYVLALGELDEFSDLSTTAFLIFLVFTILITVVLMNLVIAILSDKYEEVMASKKYYEGKAKLDKSLSYEKWRRLFCCGRRTEEEHFFLYVSKPYVLEEGDNSDWVGMIGSITKAFKKESRRVEEKIDE